MALRLPIDVALSLCVGPAGVAVICENDHDTGPISVVFNWDEVLGAATDPVPPSGHRMSHTTLLATAEALATIATRIREHVAHDLKPTRDE